MAKRCGVHSDSYDRMAAPSIVTNFYTAKDDLKVNTPELPAMPGAVA
jgi:hypothetical protein